MAFLKDFTKRSKLRLNTEYLFFIKEATISADGSKIQVLFLLEDEKTGFHELVMQEFDPQGEEFDELLRKAVYTGEAENIVLVDFDDFKGVCARCKIAQEEGKIKILTSLIEAEVSAISKVDDLYIKYELYPWQKSQAHRD